jgi:hypothetical protein
MENFFDLRLKAEEECGHKTMSQTGKEYHKMVTLKYGPLNELKIEAGLSIASLKEKVINAFDLEVDAESLSAHCSAGEELNDDTVPDAGAEISFRNREPARKGA